MLDLESLRLFMRAAELGSLSKAAAQSNVALAAVSRRIGLLEAHYGVELLVRSGRGVTVTPAGQVLLERGSDIFQHVGLARAELSEFAKGLKGIVTLMASTSAIAQHLPADLAAFAQVCPEVRVDLREAYSDEIVAALRDGKAEVGVIIGGRNLAGLDTAPYRKDRLTIVAPNDVLPGMTSVRLLDLIQHDFVVMEDSTATNKLLSSIAEQAGVALRLRAKVGSFDAVCRMVQAGFGLGVQPRMVAQNFVDTMGLRLIDLEDDWAERQMLVCINRLNGPSAAAKRLLAHLRTCAQPE